VASYDQQFSDFVQRKGAWLRRLAVQLCGDWQHAQDFAQDTWVRLYVHWPRLRQHDDGSLTRYARTTLTRIVIDDSRRPSRKRERQLADPPDAAVRDPDAADAVAVRRALVDLPIKQRTAVVLYVMYQLPVAEIADILRCRPGTVRCHVSRGVERLRSILGDTATSVAHPGET
jgi:RNA polymerase sigma factor (sigma-70 family)